MSLSTTSAADASALAGRPEWRFLPSVGSWAMTARRPPAQAEDRGVTACASAPAVGDSQESTGSLPFAKSEPNLNALEAETLSLPCAASEPILSSFESEPRDSACVLQPIQSFLGLQETEQLGECTPRTSTASVNSNPPFTNQQSSSSAGHRRTNSSVVSRSSGVAIPERSLSGVSTAEARIRHLHEAEASQKNSYSSRLAVELPRLFELLPDDAVPHVRADLDAGLVFRKDGSAADLRGIVSELSVNDRSRVLNKIRRACPPVAADRQGFVVLSDVDDTLLPARDVLQIGGSDRSWYLDGRLYPGASTTHRELRGGLRDEHGGDYSVLLTARPPFLVRSLATKLRRIAGLDRPRIAILPGQGGAMNVAMNAVRALTGNYARLGQTKVARVTEYVSLFPDYLGRFVFIGDDGQADASAACDMLALTAKVNGANVPLMAFVAVHAVQTGDAYVVPRAQQVALTHNMRARHPALSSSSAKRRHRFFYFIDYGDLATQLAAAGWIENCQRDAILRGMDRDLLPRLEWYVNSCDLQGLRAAMNAWSQSADEADEVELHDFQKAGMALPDVALAHMRLFPPPDGTRTITIQLQRLTGYYIWRPNGEPAMPGLMFIDLTPERPARILCRSDANGCLTIPWPCSALAARASIDLVFDGGSSSVGRCFVVLDNSASALRDGGRTDVRIVAPSLPDISSPAGELTLSVAWT
eukprot:TRINITY_DN5306_c0_g1_i1.p1 TRINITY_DN5306_c0_g1~~TRINITY_DN5306_c0_g1_i1.p1  ORF type:complete len:702 (-),score=75.33 TRINITY_DN5306_c0_g1_i1:400-2505(-)